MKKKVSIGVLAYNVETYIEKILLDLLKLKTTVYVIDDKSTDKTPNILRKFKNNSEIKVIENKKNIGAGQSTYKLISKAKNDGFDMLLKVDGDGQFIFNDIERIYEIATDNNFKYIKSNRFWEKGIQGSMPTKRFFGNLLATMFLQITTGTNKLFDPLNGLFTISTSIIDDIDFKHYPKRYGYPYFYSLAAIMLNYKTRQVNNTIIYGNQKSNLKSIAVLFTILKLSIIFYIKKIKFKRNIGVFQRSAFLDILFISSLLVTITILAQIIYTVFYANYVYISLGNLLILLLFCLTLNILLFLSSFKEEKSIRNEFITSD